MKPHEIEYLRKIGPSGERHAARKPFSDPGCARNLVDLAVMLCLLPPPPALLLDLGCGTGWTSVMFAKSGYDVVGQDIAPDMIALAEANSGREEGLALSFSIGDFEVCGHSSAFDCAVFFDALHHAEDPQAALLAAYRALKPGGILLTREPGAGHASNPHTIEAVRRFGVTEAEMPPRRLFTMARSVGFTHAERFVNPGDALRSSLGIRFPDAGDSRSRPAWLLRLASLARVVFPGSRRGSICRFAK